MACAVAISAEQRAVMTSVAERVTESDLAALQKDGGAELYLNYHHLHSIPQALVDSHYWRINLRKLYLKGNIIRHMPCQLKLIINLKELYLHSNLLQQLPSGELSYSNYAIPGCVA
jgi:Leucine-rich repeat (LRR) protein